MRKRKLWQRVILSGSATIAMVATLSASSVSAAGEHDGRLTDRADHTDKNFEDYEYGRVDVADFDEYRQLSKEQRWGRTRAQNKKKIRQLASKARHRGR